MTGSDQVAPAYPVTDRHWKSTSVGRWFYVSAASILLVIVAVGFARSFYLRSLFGGSGLPAYIVLHGIALTLWFLLFLVQALLVAMGRVRIHRSLGFVGAGLAAIVLGLSAVVVVRSVVRETPLVVIGDMALLALFAILVTAGVLFRRKPESHKRLMVIASISIVAPAIARWPGAQSALPLSVILPQLLLIGAQIVYDVLSRRRVHPATTSGVTLYLIAVAITVPLASSEAGIAFVKSLE